MKVIADRFEIANGAREDDGTKLEPEQQPAKRVVDVAAATAAEMAGARGTAVPLRTSLVTEMSAVDAAVAAAEVCHRCEHFRRDLWPEFRRRMEADPDGRQQLDRVRAELLACGTAVLPTLKGDFLADVEHTLASFGLCGALGELTGQPQVVHPEASCPSTVPNMFRPASREAARTADAAKDTILFTAQGRGAK